MPERQAERRQSASASTSIWPSSTPTLNDNSDVTRCAPANWRDSRSANQKPKPWTRPKPKATSHRCANVEAIMFSIAMQTIESAMSVSMSGGNQRARGREVEGRRDERDRVRDGKGGDDGHEGPEPANRDGEAQEEEQVIRAAEDVGEPELHESPGRLVPARIEADESRVADPLEGAHGTPGREKPHGRGDAHTEPREGRLDREGGPIRTDVVLEQDVEHATGSSRSGRRRRAEGP